MTPLPLAHRNVRRAWVAYYGGLVATVVIAVVIGTWTNNLVVTVAVSLILGAVLAVRTSNRLLAADLELAAAEREAS